MMHVRGRVRRGWLRIEEPIDLPDDTDVELVVTDAGDALDQAERERLHQAIYRGKQQIERGEFVPVEQVFAELDAEE